MVETVGTCYEDAWRFLLKEEEGELIHGSVQLSAEGPRVNHAWVELPTGLVWEPQTKSYFTIEDFKIMAPLEEHRYSVTEAAVMLARVGKHGPWTKEEREQFIKRGNPDRVRFDRADIDSAIAAAKRLKSEKNLYVFATYLGYTIDKRPPPGMQSYVVVYPDGSTETIKPSIGGNPEPWQMTREGWLRYSERETKKAGFEWTSDSVKRTERQHRGYVKAAMYGGLPVPAEVLKDYPEVLQPQERGNPMTQTEGERKSFQERIFGKATPLERLGGGQAVNNMLPMPPDSGPPLPRVLGLKWPWKD